MLPILREEKTLSCFLPAEYKCVKVAPVPVNGAITLRSVPERVVAVKKFTGKFGAQLCTEVLNNFKQRLVTEGLLNNDEASSIPAGESADATTPLLIPYATHQPAAEGTPCHSHRALDGGAILSSGIQLVLPEKRVVGGCRSKSQRK